MTLEDKAGERTMLILQLGQLLAPIVQLADKFPPSTSVDYRIVAATFEVDVNHWANEVSRFVVIGGVRFSHEYDDIVRSQRHLLRELVGLAKTTSQDDTWRQERLKTLLEEYRTKTLDAIDQVPITWQPQLLEARTPFSTYLKIRDAVGTAIRRIHYFDRYVDDNFFPLYLRHVDRSLEIRLVTTKGNQNYGITNVTPVSRLAAQEFSDYRLIERQPSDIHDRNLRVDDNIFHFGSSVKDAGRHPMNFTLADSSPQAHQIFDNLISGGKVVT